MSGSARDYPGARVSYDAAVLDLGLPVGDGLAVLATLEQMMRRFGRIIPKGGARGETLRHG
jgi:CheY-like chemotaxis protein